MVKLLLVDDEPSVLDALELAFDDAGHETERLRSSKLTKGKFVDFLANHYRISYACLLLSVKLVFDLRKHVRYFSILGHAEDVTRAIRHHRRRNSIPRCRSLSWN